MPVHAIGSELASEWVCNTLIYLYVRYGIVYTSAVSPAETNRAKERKAKMNNLMRKKMRLLFLRLLTRLAVRLLKFLLVFRQHRQVSLKKER